MEDDTGKSSYVIDSESESIVQTETGTRKKTFIFHREEYIAKSLTKALDYSEDSYSSFHKSKSLIDHLKENPTLLLLSGDSPEDLKYILNKVFGGIKANMTPILIFSLSNPKSLISINKTGFEELQECFGKNLLDIIHMPFDQISEIKDKIVKQKNEYQNNHEQRGKMWTKVAERRAEQKDVSQRHINKNLQAAERILNGALRSGDYDLLDSIVEESAISCYKRLISAHPVDEEKEIKEAMETIDKMKRCVQGYVKEVWHKDINKILVIDDQKKMWEPVWGFIFGDKKVNVVGDGEKGLDKIVNGGRYDCVLLDIDLGKDENGKDKENGIEVLQRIKHEQFDMPVIMMTAYDDAEVTKAGLQYGATNYFVKEMVDISDRNSVDYYDKLKEIMKVPHYRTPQREIWRNYKLIESKINSIDIAWKTFIGKHLRKAYFFLILDNDFLLPKELLLSQKRDNYTDVVINIEFALYQISSVLYAFNNKVELVSAIESLNKKKDNSPGSKVQYANIIEIIEKSFNTKIKEADPLNKILKRARHSSSKVSKDDAIALVELAIYYSNKLVNNLKVKGMDALKKGFATGGFKLKTNILKLRNSILSHEEISAEGANTLKEGFELCGNKEISSEILFIDDEGSKSEWYPVLNSIFDKVTVFEKIEDITKENNLTDFDLILLDLNLYSQDYNEGCKRGLETLSAIKEINFTIPVIMLTATNSSYFTKKAFLKGAFDYFTKDTVLDPELYWNLFNNIIQKALEITNEEKQLWEKLLELKSLIEGIKTSNTKLKNYLNDINESIYAPLKSAYFHYILISRGHNLPEVYTIEKLLTEENPKNDFLFLCGTAIEGLMKVLWRVLATERGKVPDAGFLVRNFSDYALCKNFTEIWRCRTISKTKSMNIDFKRHLEKSLGSVTKALTHTHTDNVKKYYFNVPNSGHEIKRRTSGRNQKTTSNKPRKFDKTSKTKKLKVPQSSSKQRVTNAKRKTKGLITDPEEIKKMFLEMREKRKK